MQQNNHCTTDYYTDSFLKQNRVLSRAQGTGRADKAVGVRGLRPRHRSRGERGGLLDQHKAVVRSLPLTSYQVQSGVQQKVEKPLFLEVIKKEDSTESLTIGSIL